MATNYPSGLDSFTNPAGTDALSTGHAAQHANANDAVEAIEAELGTNPSGSELTVKARFETIEANDWVTTARIGNSQVTSAKIADATITGSDIATGTVTSTNIANDTIVNADVNSAAAIDKTKIAGTAVTVADTGTVTSTMILDGTIATADLADGAITPIKTSGGYVAKTALYTATNDDRVIDCTTGTYTITLPTAASQTGRIFVIRNSGTGTITIGRTGAETIAGGTSQTLAGYGHLEVMSNGTNWLVLRGTYTDETVGRRIFTWDTVNSRWQMTYGDTGWRDISALLTVPANVTILRAYLRRVSSSVFFALAGSNANGTAQTVSLTGWTGSAGMTPTAEMSTVSASLGQTSIAATLYYYSYSPYLTWTMAANAAAHYPLLAGSTSAAWPTALPGSAVGTIPT